MKWLLDTVLGVLMEDTLFRQLLNEFDKLYGFELCNQGVPEYLCNMARSGELRTKRQLWEEAVPHLIASPDRNALVESLLNPYVAGLGYPTASILFVGQEQAFDANDLDLLFYGSIANLALWRDILARDALDRPGEALRRRGGSPAFPNATRGVRKHSHTWGIYSKVLAFVLWDDSNRYKELLWEEDDPTRAFSRYCFMTELYDRPARRHRLTRVSPRRRHFLRHPFFRRFPVTVIGAGDFRKEISEIETIFGVMLHDQMSLDYRTSVTIFRDESGRVVYATRQLSGDVSREVIWNLGGMIRAQLRLGAAL